MTAHAVRGFAVLTAAAIVPACGGRTPTGPEPTPSLKIATGAQILRITPPRCADVTPGLPFVYTRIVVNQAGTEWIATSDGAAAGDVALRFRQAPSTAILAGMMKITGTIAGTAVHMPELLPAFPPSPLHARFGPNGETVLDGVAFEAGAFPLTSAGLDGMGLGPITVIDAAGVSCSGSRFSWAVFPPEAR